ncbi:MAG: DUF559 domain-containing protein [Proteobacteria bacterium]|nr:DUF559 domain-containing protein [Pseudomonadota bacterium]
MRDGAHKQIARTLRRESTDAERVLWRHLRHKQIAGYRFRRQSSIGPYVADFVCLEARLVVDVDGSQHGQAQDAHRDGMLAEFGFRIVRFWNNDVLTKTDEVLASFHQALAATSPHPAFGHLPPQAGEGTKRAAS